MFGKLGAAAIAPGVHTATVSCAMPADEAPLNAVAGVDRVTILPGKTYLRGWAGYGDPPRPERPRGPQAAQAPPSPPAPSGPEPGTLGSKESGRGQVKFEDPKALITTATFSAPWAYVLKLSADNGQARSASV